MKIIIGLDFSKNSPGIMLSKVDNNFDILSTHYLGFTTIKKISKSDNNIIFYKKDNFNSDIEQAIWIKTQIINFINIHGDSNSSIWCAIEGYAFNANGKVFDIAESTMCTKLALYDMFISLRIYDPSSIKKIATNIGNAGKVEMCDAYYKLINKPDLTHLPKYKNPLEDLIDAYYGMLLLQLELKLRYGILELKNLNSTHIEIFNRVTKSNPENVLVKSFIKKNEELCL